MKLDAWQVRLAIRVLKGAAYVRRHRPAAGLTLAYALRRRRERDAIQCMAAALESGESLEVGPAPGAAAKERP